MFDRVERLRGTKGRRPRGFEPPQNRAYRVASRYLTVRQSLQKTLGYSSVLTFAISYIEAAVMHASPLQSGLVAAVGMVGLGMWAAVKENTKTRILNLDNLRYRANHAIDRKNYEIFR